MIKQRFFYLLTSLLVSLSGCQTTKAGSELSTPNALGSAVLPVLWERDALSAYYRARRHFKTEDLQQVQLVSIQGQWIDANLWGEWEYTFAHDQSLWIYNAQGLRLKHALTTTKPLPTLSSPDIDILLQGLSAHLSVHPPLLAEKYVAAVSWTSSSGWTYHTPIESTPQ